MSEHKRYAVLTFVKKGKEKKAQINPLLNYPFLPTAL